MTSTLLITKQKLPKEAQLVIVEPGFKHRFDWGTHHTSTVIIVKPKTNQTSKILSLRENNYL